MILKKIKTKNLPIVVPLLIIFLSSLGLNIFQFLQIKSLSQGTLVIGIIDGDTLVLEGKTRLGLRQIDAPSLEYCGGQEAKALLEKLVLNKEIIFKEKIIDTQGRAMALIYVGNKLINQEMLKSGWVRYHSDQTPVTKELKATADQARKENLGIFSPLCYQTQNPDDPKCVIKGNYDKNSTLSNYYFPGCPQYDFTIVEKDLGESWFCTEKQAQEAGFTKAKNCPENP
jgi:micrococcal nuclease